jgi:protein-S-isoprenylcysteine O-methyltransferase Ste14
MRVGLALGVVFGLGWIPLYVFRPESHTDSLPSYQGAERLWVRLTPALVAAHMTATCLTLEGMTAVPAWSAIMALVTFAVAIAFWFWARVMVGPLRTRRLPDEPPVRLRCDGPFGVVRHPMYFGYLVAAAAPLLVARRPFLLMTYALCVLAMAVRAVQEERRLRDQLGAAYAAYCRRVKRLVPYVW